MVKNNKGGSGHKKMAHKDVFPNRVAAKTRLAEDEYECYAYVVSMSGGQHCITMCQDGKSRLCIIRGKFRGAKGKRDNFITRGCWVLVGIREWSSETNKEGVMDKCDLLEVYNESDKIKLKTISGINWGLFINNDLSLVNSIKVKGDSTHDLYDDGNIEFTNNVVEDEYKDLISSRNPDESIRLNTTHVIYNKGKDGGGEDEGEEEINIDDI